MRVYSVQLPLDHVTLLLGIRSTNYMFSVLLAPCVLHITCFEFRM